MNITAKDEVLPMLTTDIDIRESVPASQGHSCVIINGHASIQAFINQPIAKHSEIIPPLLSGKYIAITVRIASGFMLSLTGTSAAIVLRLVPVRTMKHRPEHKIIMGRDVALQHIWDQFIALDENKANLAYFLSIMLMSVRT